MTKSQLIDLISGRAEHVPHREVEAIVNAVFDAMLAALVRGERIEIRGFGSFSVKERRARSARNPKTGKTVQVPDRRTLSFTVGKELRDRLNPDGVEQGGRVEKVGGAPGVSQVARAEGGRRRGLEREIGEVEPLVGASAEVPRYGVK